MLRRHDARDEHADADARASIAGALGRTCRRRASRRAFWKKCRRSCSRNWTSARAEFCTAEGGCATERADYGESRHYSYEDEDQSERPQAAGNGKTAGRSRAGTSYTGPSYNSIDNIAEFFASRGKKFSRPRVPVPEPTGKKGFKPGQRVVHPKYGEGTVYKREGDGEDAKITVQFPRFGLKKLVEKFAQLEKA